MEIQWPLLIFSVLLGASSGIFVFLAIGEITKKFQNVRFAGALIALVCLAVGGCVSVLHMGHPERAVHLLGNVSSGLAKELLATAAMGIALIIYLVTTKKNYTAASRIVAVIGGILGLVLPFIAGASYLIAARPAWNSITLPLMYVGAGLAVGFLIMSLVVVVKSKDESERKLALKLALGGVVVMVITAIAYVAWIAHAPHQADSRSIERLISGDMAVAFWGAVVFIGLIVPLVSSVLAYLKGKVVYLGIALAASLVGIVALRIIMYFVGTSVEQFIYL